MRTIVFEGDGVRRVFRSCYIAHPDRVDPARPDMDLRPGDRVRIEPVNPANKKHRGRECLVVGVQQYHKVDGKSDGRLKVRFVDNERPGLIDATEIVPAAPLTSETPLPSASAPTSSSVIESEGETA